MLATHDGNRYVTQIDVSSGVGAREVLIGHTLPRGTHPQSVLLDGRAVHNFALLDTNRGTELTIGTGAGHHTLIVTA